MMNMTYGLRQQGTAHWFSDHVGLHRTSLGTKGVNEQSNKQK